MYTIFKNLTIILIVSAQCSLESQFPCDLLPLKAYGEVLWFGGKVTGLTFISFIFMVSLRDSNTELQLILGQVLSSVIAAWTDVSAALGAAVPADPALSLGGFEAVSGAVRKLNIGYFWMLINCITSAAYVSMSHPIMVNVH